MAISRTILGVLLAASAGTAGTAGAADRLYACGDDQVREYRIDRGTAVETWRWQAATAPGLTDEYRATLMAHIDDCKPMNDAREILLTSSTGGALLIERATGRVLFRAKVPMAHSGTLLPGGRVAIALSIEPRGDRLEIYDVARSETPLFQLPLPSGHGAVWDTARMRLFTVSHDVIQAFSLVDWTSAAPSLKETARWTLPGRRDGHDLSARPDGRYFVTTDDGVWVFDPGAGRFDRFAPLNPRLKVKSVSARAHAIAWVQAEESWWAHGFTVARPNGRGAFRIPVDALHLYKVRWLP